MCEFADSYHKSRAIQYFRGRTIQNALPPGFFGRFPFALTAEGCCPTCGKYLEYWERRPAGRATRSMCAQDYENVIAKRIDGNCFVCGLQLQNHKVQAQYRNPREVEHHIHDGNCNMIWTVVHNVAIGEPFGDSRPLDDGSGNDDFIDAEFNSMPTLPLRPAPRALPAPGQRLPNLFQRTHKGKPVRTL